jgi:hypothetical protein
MELDMASHVVLDPGHGGNDARRKSSADGRQFADGNLEQHVVYNLATHVARQLGGATLTRPTDDNRSLRERIDVARGHDARVFVSLHAHGREGAGEAWVHDRAEPASVALAGFVAEELAVPYGARAGLVRRADLAVLSPEHHAPGTAACLVDLGYQGPDGSVLADASRQELVAAAIARGIRRFAAAHPEPRRSEALVVRVPRFGSPHGLMEKYTSATAWDPPPPPIEPAILPADADALRTIGALLERGSAWTAAVADAAAFPFSAICKLRITLADGNAVEGTGFFVAPDRIVTAGRCVRWNRVPAVSVQVTPGLHGTSEPFGSFVVPASAIAPFPEWDDAGTEHDLAMLRTDVAHAAWLDRLESATTGSIAVCGYAATDPDHQQLDGDVACDALGEAVSVGSPVFQRGGDGDPVVTGILISGWSRPEAGQPAIPFRACCPFTPHKLAWIRGALA